MKENIHGHSAVMVVWSGPEAESIQTTAAMMGLGPQDLVRWAVTKVLRESTFLTAEERDGSGRGRPKL